MITRLVVVEDQPRILTAQVALLSEVPDLEVVGQALTAERGLERVLAARPDVALVDLGLPGMSGIELTARIRAAAPTVDVLVWSIFEDPRSAQSAVAAGAAGYLLKGTPVGELADAVRAVRAGGGVVSPRLARPLFELLPPPPAGPPPSWPPGASTDATPGSPGNGYAAPKLTYGSFDAERLVDARLSARERELLHILSRGLTNAELAEVLGVSVATVRTHLARVFTKLDVTNRVEAVTEGFRRGLIDF